MTQHRFIQCGMFAGIITGLALLSACATISGIVGNPLEPLNVRGNTIGVLVLVPEKRVEFWELVQKALIGIKSVDDFYTFEGIWDPAPLFYEHLGRTLESQYGTKCIPLRERVDAQAYAKFVAACEAAFNESRLKQVGGMQGSAFLLEFQKSPPADYLKAPLTQHPDEMRKTLGTDLVLEVSLGGIACYRGDTIAMDVAYLYVPVYGRLVRLSDGKVLRYTKGLQRVSLPSIRSFSDIEKDNLALLKWKYEDAVQLLLNPNGAFLKNLMK